jgi:hypothetical protein
MNERRQRGHEFCRKEGLGFAAALAQLDAAVHAVKMRRAKDEKLP